jgi:hypothetical protein
MNLKTIPYLQYENGLPQKGRYILGQLRDNNILVYQAFNPQISAYAVQHQQFGGPAYSFSRMSWIKPNFLWMMYRAGWAGKANQERILAIEIGLDKFETILEQAVYSSFQPDIYASTSEWNRALSQSEVRLQWDPDHNPKGQKLERRAVQLGMKGTILQSFASEWIVSIEDITDFVVQQGTFVNTDELHKLEVPIEQVIPVKNPLIHEKLKIGAE